MSEEDYFTIKELVDILDVSSSFLYAKIRNDELTAIKKGGKHFITRDDKFTSLSIDLIHQKYLSPEEAYFPDELEQYEYWHQVIDNLVWLFKIVYSSKEDIKKKKFRTDLIFQAYMQDNGITLKKVKSSFDNDVKRVDLIEEDLKRGWYNELAFIYPLKHSTLGLSFKDIEVNYDISSERFLFPSWGVVKSYYAIYFFLRPLSLMKNSTFRIQEHKATIRTFKNNVIPKLKNSLWQFPFTIEANPGKRVYRRRIPLARLDYTKYEYCKHPRSPHLSPEEVFEKLYKEFQKRSNSFKKKSHYTIFDFFLEFRIWANYLDISNLLNLYGKGYKGFLDQNLSFILFMIGGISELSIIGRLGEEVYLRCLNEFYGLFASTKNKLKSEFVNTAMYQRLVIYKKLGFVEGSLKVVEEENVNEVKFRK